MSACRSSSYYLFFLEIRFNIVLNFRREIWEGIAFILFLQYAATVVLQQRNACSCLDFKKWSWSYCEYNCGLAITPSIPPFCPRGIDDPMWIILFPAYAYHTGRISAATYWCDIPLQIFMLFRLLYIIGCSWAQLVPLFSSTFYPATIFSSPIVEHQAEHIVHHQKMATQQNNPLFCHCPRRTEESVPEQ